MNASQGKSIVEVGRGIQIPPPNTVQFPNKQSPRPEEELLPQRSATHLPGAEAEAHREEQRSQPSLKSEPEADQSHGMQRSDNQSAVAHPLRQSRLLARQE